MNKQELVRNEMENRKRNIQMKFYVTEEEKRLIDEKMKHSCLPRPFTIP